jgi:hypothetical protein
MARSPRTSSLGATSFLALSTASRWHNDSSRGGRLRERPWPRRARPLDRPARGSPRPVAQAAPAAGLASAPGSCGPMPLDRRPRPMHGAAGGETRSAWPAGCGPPSLVLQRTAPAGGAKVVGASRVACLRHGELVGQHAQCRPYRRPLVNHDDRVLNRGSRGSGQSWRRRWSSVSATGCKGP